MCRRWRSRVSKQQQYPSQHQQVSPSRGLAQFHVVTPGQVGHDQVTNAAQVNLYKAASNLDIQHTHTHTHTHKTSQCHRLSGHVPPAAAFRTDTSVVATSTSEVARNTSSIMRGTTPRVSPCNTTPRPRPAGGPILLCASDQAQLRNRLESWGHIDALIVVTWCMFFHCRFDRSRSRHHCSHSLLLAPVACQQSGRHCPVWLCGQATRKGMTGRVGGRPAAIPASTLVGRRS